MTGTASNGRTKVAVRLDERGNPAPANAAAWADASRYLDECQLDRLLLAGQVADREWRAGMLFRARWIAAHAGSSYGIRYAERVDGGGWASESDRRLTAQDEIRAALEDLPETAARAVQAVAGGDEKAAGRMNALRLGLDRLAAFYGVPAGFKRRPGL